MGYGQYTLPYYRRGRGGRWPAFRTPGDPFLYHTRQNWRKNDLMTIARRRWRFMWDCRLFKYRTLEFRTMSQIDPASHGMRVWQLYMTPIVVVDPGHTVTLDTGGWNTMTTRRRMTEVLRERLGVKAYVWGHNGGNQLNIEYADGPRQWAFKRRLRLPYSTVMGERDDTSD